MPAPGGGVVTDADRMLRVRAPRELIDRARNAVAGQHDAGEVDASLDGLFRRGLVLATAEVEERLNAGAPLPPRPGPLPLGRRPARR